MQKYTQLMFVNVYQLEVIDVVPLHCKTELEKWLGVIVLLKDVKTSMWCICSPSDLCIGSDAGVGRKKPILVM